MSVRRKEPKIFLAFEQKQKFYLITLLSSIALGKTSFHLTDRGTLLVCITCKIHN